MQDTHTPRILIAIVSVGYTVGHGDIIMLSVSCHGRCTCMLSELEHPALAHPHHSYSNCRNFIKFCLGHLTDPTAVTLRPIDRQCLYHSCEMLSPC